MSDYDWDHIDPDYPKGAYRPYQLVCGLTNSFNLIERDHPTNASKSNRFLPWRVSKDEIGSVPVNFGDLCQFLDRETGEWVLEEFMGDWYKEQTRDLCGQHISGRRTYEEKLGFWSFTKEQRSEVCRRGSENQSLESKALGGRNGVKTQKEKGLGIFGLTSEQKTERAKKARAATTLETLSKGGVAASKKKYLCLVSGFISNAPTVARIQKMNGIDKSFRVSLDSVYFLIRSLCLIQ